MVNQVLRKGSQVERIVKGLLLIFVAVGLIVAVTKVIDMLQANVDNFANASAKVTYYYMDGCPHCRNFKPEWEKFKAAAAAAGIEALDVAAQDMGSVTPKVVGFPTVHVEVKGKVTEYKGERTADALHAFVKKLA